MKKLTPILTGFALSVAMLPVTSISTVHAAEVEGPVVKWNASSWGKRRSATEGLEGMVKVLKEKTGGKFDITIHYGGSLSKPKENLDGLQIGAFEMGMFCGAYHPAKTPALSVLDLPMIPYTDMKQQVTAYEAIYQHPEVIKEMNRWNSRIVMGALLPTYVFMGRGEPPMKLADWKGRKVRALGGMGHAMKKLGAVPTAVTAPEVYTALERGTLDSVAFALYAHKAYGIIPVAKWYTDNLVIGTIHCAVAANNNAFDKLPKQYQDLMLGEAAAYGYTQAIAAYAADDVKVIETLKEQGLTKITYDSATIKAFQKEAGKPVWNDWIKKHSAKGIPAQEILDLLLSKTGAGN